MQILLYALIPVFTMLAGGGIALLKTPGKNLRSFILHFAAGVIFPVVAVELLPDLIHNHSTLMAIIGFIIGFLVMIGVRKLTLNGIKRESTQEAKMLPLNLLIRIYT